MDFTPRTLPSLGLCFLAFLTALATPAPVFAVDADDNGLSDVWEILYPMPPGQEDGDFDLDGHTHRQEAAAGLDPFSFASRLKLNLVPKPATATLDINFETVRGHLYQVERRVLPSLSWDPVGDVATSILGGTLSVSIPMPTSPGVAHIFRYRVVGRLYSDADELSDWEESILNTDPFHSDTDGDGLDDGFEFRYSAWGLDPLNPYSLDPTGRMPDGSLDSDGDGATNSEESSRASNPFDTGSPGVGGSALTLFTPLE